MLRTYSYVILLFLTSCHPRTYFFFFFNDTATTEIYTLSLHDALPISACPQTLRRYRPSPQPPARSQGPRPPTRIPEDRKSTRLNSSHLGISYAVFCLKKKKQLIKAHNTIIVQTMHSFCTICSSIRVNT